jgi:Ca2+-binding RTX toxin-like protein
MVSLSLTNGAFGKDDAGNAVTGLTYDFSEISYSTSGSGSGSIGDYFGDEADPWATFGVDYSGNFQFETGLTGEVHVDLGHIDTELEFGTESFVVNGVANEAAALDTSGFTLDTYTIDPVGFDLAESYIELGFHAGLAFELTAALYGSYNLGLGIADSFNTTLFENAAVDIDFDYTLIPKTAFDIIGGFDGNIFKFELGDYVEVSVDIPVFEYEDAEYIENDEGLDTIHIVGESSPFLTLEIGLASFILPPGIGPVGFDLSDLLPEFVTDYFSIGIEGGLFDAKLVATASIGQDITATSEVLTEIVTSLGETLSGSLGDEFVFETPEGEGEFTATAYYTLSQTVEAVTSLILNSAIDWRVLFAQFEAKVDLGSIFSDTFETSWALFEDSVDLGELLGLTASFELFNDITTYLSEAGEEEYTVAYENFVTAASGAVLTLTTHQDDIIGGTIANTITGNDRDNVIFGLAGDDTILGNDGDDRLFGGKGADSIDGGEGFDIASYQRSRASLLVDLAENGASGGEATGDHLSGVEGVIGSRYGDHMTGDDEANFFSGRDGDDAIYGGGGNDTLIGGAGADTIDGGDGSDTLRFAKSDTGVSVNLETGVGLLGEAAGDVYVSVENVAGTDGDDVIVGNDSNNRLRGGLGADVISGGDGNDTIEGDFGADTLSGGDGIDTLIFRNSANPIVVDLENGTANNFMGDLLADGNDSLSGFENVVGTDYTDNLGGSSEANVIVGGGGADQMFGRAGDDSFGVGGGNDTVFGGSDFDTIYIDGDSTDYTVEQDIAFGRFIITKLTGNQEVYEINNVEHVVFAETEFDLVWQFSPF